MDWTDEPATWRQLKSLRELGYTLDHRLTKIEAAEIIRNLGGKPDNHGVATTIEEKPHAGAYQLRLKVEKIRRTIAEAGRNKAEKMDHELASAIGERQEFWIDTCLGVGTGQVASMEIPELYQHHGCRFEPPSRADVQYILDALDQAMPQWDKDHPELFFQTLELNFPALVRHPGGL
jgi:hypothetical protein